MECSKIRRKDRAITDYYRMLEIMNQCDICRLGLQDDESVYIVPLNLVLRQIMKNLLFISMDLLKGKRLN